MPLLFCLMILFSSTAKAEEPTSLPWAIYYGLEDKTDELRPYQLLVLEPHHKHPIRDFVAKDKTVLGYVSLGEMNESHPFFAKAKAADVFLEMSENWEGSHLVDLRESAWQALVIEDIIPMVLHYGVTGLFLDTLDNAVMLERRNPKKYAGMQAAAGQLIARIKAHYPSLKLMQNRGFELLEETATHVDMLLAESTYSTYHFEEKTHRLLSENDRAYYLEQLQRARELAPTLDIFTLDYWDEKDTNTIRRIYQVQRAKGYHPYVAPISLTSILPEPQ